jgi:hypothetical protein
MHPAAIPHILTTDASSPMKRLLLLALTAATLLISSGATACEKHLNGHQNGSDANLEGSRK